MDFAHVVEFEKSVSRKREVRRRIAEPFKAAALNFVGEQSLIALSYVITRFKFDFRCQRVCRDHVLKDQNIRISRRRSLLEAAVRYLEYRIEPFDRLTHKAGIDFYEKFRAVGDRIFGDCQFYRFAAVEYRAFRLIFHYSVGFDCDGALYSIGHL